VLAKFCPPHNRSVREVAAEEGISEATLYNWRKDARQRGELYPDAGADAQDWRARLAGCPALFAIRCRVSAGDRGKYRDLLSIEAGARGGTYQRVARYSRVTPDTKNTNRIEVSRSRSARFTSGTRSALAMKKKRAAKQRASGKRHHGLEATLEDSLGQKDEQSTNDSNQAHQEPEHQDDQQGAIHRMQQSACASRLLLC